MTGDEKTFWEVLWEYDPNGLVAVDSQGIVRVVNPAFCRMFGVEAPVVSGRPVTEILDDAEIFDEVRRSRQAIVGRERHYPRHNLYVKQVVFPAGDDGVVACIMVNMTDEWRQRERLRTITRESLAKMERVVDRQMKVAQEIAGLLGETTAETKLTLLELTRMLEQEKP